MCKRERKITTGHIWQDCGSCRENQRRTLPTGQGMEKGTRSLGLEQSCEERKRRPLERTAHLECLLLGQRETELPHLHRRIRCQ